VNDQIVQFQRHTLRHQAEDVSATRAFVLQHVVPIPDGLDADQVSLEVAVYADRRGHVRFRIGCWVEPLYRGGLVSPVNLRNRTNTGRINTGAEGRLLAAPEAKKARDKLQLAQPSASAGRASLVNS
jgi:hypothetical protein